MSKVGRNDPCPCGSGKKYKNCHQETDAQQGGRNKAFLIGILLILFVVIAAVGVYLNEKDLMDALMNNQIWGAGLDVTNPEPMEASNPLLSMENVAITPHIGSATEQARDVMSRLAARNIIHFFQKKDIPHLVNPHYNL